ncbi:nucleotidyltransferase domain-containing protein [Pseudanabaena yagii]|uniref:Nucleotidyltransferase domain-containing protein n=1 Tax=Pseudanabaena yagii GIHE-NHR1 TaxID=2722753 RepID=A0ABX1LY77_9CYAN|nr:nucleotidyltransferase domain-containing protein [Pseudanabaena yagii]NMF59679.1 nucleotidyltransferase domain-containing protein [Pseudanabaena yagii GIHE-NHR1]
MKSDRLQSLLQELKIQLENLYGDRLASLLLYGSVARGEATDNSDIDVLVVLHDRVLPIQEIRRMADIRLHFLLEFGELVSIMPMSLEEFSDRSASFANNVRREGIAL